MFDSADASEVLRRLETSDEGAAFLRDFRSYLDEFGWRADAFEMSDPTWREDPTIAVNTLQGYMRLDDDQDPENQHQEAVRNRERLLAQAREALAGDPESLGKFNGLYEMARHYLVLTEDHNYYIDQVGNGIMRLPLLELGTRLTEADALSDPSDIFHLHMDEIRAGMSGADHKTAVADRRAELERWSEVVPVPTIGEPPPPNEDPLGAAFAQDVRHATGAEPRSRRNPGYWGIDRHRPGYGQSGAEPHRGQQGRARRHPRL